MLGLEMHVVAFPIRGEPPVDAPVDVAGEPSDSKLALAEALLGELHLDSLFALFEFGLLNRKELVAFTLL